MQITLLVFLFLLPVFFASNPRAKPAPTYTLVEPAQRQVLTVAASTRQVRPFACCAILRGMKFDDKVYKSFIDLQDKLHQVGDG